jgi:hypothetical protein
VVALHPYNANIACNGDKAKLDSSGDNDLSRIGAQRSEHQQSCGFMSFSSVPPDKFLDKDCLNWRLLPHSFSSLCTVQVQRR